MLDHEGNCPWPELQADINSHLRLLTRSSAATPWTLTKTLMLNTPRYTEETASKPHTSAITET